MTQDTDWVPIPDIIVGDRLRQDFGDIKALAKSIDTHGLFHPIVIDANNHLIAGERRLRAMQELGWTKAEVRQFEELSESERRVLELEENLLRKDLTAYERSRNLTDLATAAEAVDRETGEITLSDSDRVSAGRRGPDQVPGSSTRVSERLGVPRTTINEAKKHVAAAESYPFLQQPGWKQYQALEAAEILDSIPSEDRQPIMDLVDQPLIHPRDAIDALRNVAQKPAAERKQIARLAQSDDSRERDLALTTAVARPPMPDDRIPLIRHAQSDLKKAITLHPTDEEVTRLQHHIDELDDLIVHIKERTGNARTPIAA